VEIQFSVSFRDFDSVKEPLGEAEDLHAPRETPTLTQWVAPDLSPTPVRFTDKVVGALLTYDGRSGRHSCGAPI